jgi:hypothetical protein
VTVEPAREAAEARALAARQHNRPEPLGLDHGHGVTS